MTIDELGDSLYVHLKSLGYENIEYTDDYILAEGDISILLIAHIDTVFNTEPSMDDFLYDNKKKILWSPYGSGFDDRAGVYAILKILDAGYRPSILFTTGEEMGGVGSTMLISKHPTPPIYAKFMIQLDRANRNDSVYYSCGNKNFEKMINSYGFKTAQGTFTDISIIGPEWDIAAVNLSIGYVDEHTFSERLYTDWCDATIEKVMDILDDADAMKSYSYQYDSTGFRFPFVDYNKKKEHYASFLD